MMSWWIIIKIYYIYTFNKLNNAYPFIIQSGLFNVYMDIKYNE